MGPSPAATADAEGTVAHQRPQERRQTQGDRRPPTAPDRRELWRLPTRVSVNSPRQRDRRGWPPL